MYHATRSQASIISQVIEISGGHAESKGDDEDIYTGARSFEKATLDIAKIKEIHPAADLHVLLMDYKSLESVVMAVKADGTGSTV